MNSGRHNAFTRQLIIDIFCTGLTIGLLILSSLQAYQLVAARTSVLSEVLSFSESNLDLMVEHALTGSWPADSTGLMATEKYPSLQYENGAFHIHLTSMMNDLQNQIISIRPLTPSGDDLGPVVWIAGSSRNKTVHGSDQTTLSGQFILPSLK